MRTAGKLEWIRQTGARLRLLDAVETGLMPRRPRWDDIADPLDPGFVRTLLEWALEQKDMQAAVREAYRLDNEDISPVKEPFINAVSLWLKGARFREIAPVSNLELDAFLNLHGRVVSYTLQALVEQGVALLAKLLEDLRQPLASAVLLFPEHLRFGVPTAAARILASGGIRHRSAAIELGNALMAAGVASEDRGTIFTAALRSLEAYGDPWQQRLGSLVFNNTRRDLSSAAPGDKDHS